MAAVLAQTATNFQPFRELYASPIVVQQAHTASHLEDLPSAYMPLYSYGLLSYHSSPDLNGIGQPGSIQPEARSLAFAASHIPHNPTAATPVRRPASPLVSPRGMIVVLSHTPSEGEANIPVTVTVELRLDAAGEDSAFANRMSLNSMKLRLVFGRTAVRTLVNRLPSPSQPDSNGETEQKNVLRLRLHANAPPHSEVRFPEFRVPLTVQAMDDSTEILDSFTFGYFTYWTPSKRLTSCAVPSTSLTCQLVSYCHPCSYHRHTQASPASLRSIA